MIPDVYKRIYPGLTQKPLVHSITASFCPSDEFKHFLVNKLTSIALFTLEKTSYKGSRRHMS